MSLTLVIGNKAYSSWSLRPWLALRQLGVPFEEQLIPLRQTETQAQIGAAGGAGKVPILKDGEITIWESLAILDYVDTFHAGGRLWPRDAAGQAFARSMAAEMHAGFAALRSHLPFNVRRRLVPYAITPEARRDIDRIVDIWQTARTRFGAGGEFLFGQFSAADAMFAPIVMRLHHYVVPVPPEVRAYMDAIVALPAMQNWVAGAALEPWTIEDSERY